MALSVFAGAKIRKMARTMCYLVFFLVVLTIHSVFSVPRVKCALCGNKWLSKKETRPYTDGDSGSRGRICYVCRTRLRKSQVSKFLNSFMHTHF